MRKLSVLLFLLLTGFYANAENNFSWSDQSAVIWQLNTNVPEQSVAVSFSDWCVFLPNAVSGKAGVRAILNQMAASGVRKVWWRTFGGGRAQYASHVPGVTIGYYPGTGESFAEFDPLAEAVSYAHKLGMKIYAWYTPLEEAHAWPYNVRSRYVDNHPEMAAQTPKHKVDAPSFFYKQYRQYKIDLGMEMVTRYKTDGLVIDFERRGAPGRNNTWGYIPEIVDGYKKKTGIDPLKLPSNDKDWCAYRAQYFGMVMKALHDGIKKLDRPVAFDVMVREKQPVSAHWNIPEWIKQGWIDKVIISAYGPEGWGSLSDGKKTVNEYRATGIPVGLQCYAYRPGDIGKMMARAESVIKGGYDEMVWFESTPLNYRHCYNVPRRIACLDAVQLHSPEVDMTGGGKLIVLAAGKWSLWIDNKEKPIATGIADQAKLVSLPQYKGKHSIHIKCMLDNESQKAGIVLQGRVKDSAGKFAYIHTGDFWMSDGKATNKVTAIAMSGVPPFLGDMFSGDLSDVKIPNALTDNYADKKQDNTKARVPGVYDMHDFVWRGKWIWGPRRKSAPAYDVNVYDWMVKYPGGNGQTLVNRIVGNAANGGLSKIYWHLDDGHGRLLFPADISDEILKWPNWGVDFGAVDMPAKAMKLAEECGMDCSLIIDKSFRDIARNRYPEANILQPSDIAELPKMKADKNPKAANIAQKWLTRKEYCFRKIFIVTNNVKSAQICITAEKKYELYFDGKLLGYNADWWQGETYNIDKLSPGKHIIAVKVNPGKNTSGLLANMRWRDENGKMLYLTTDESWQVHAGEYTGWNTLDGSNANWKSVSIVGIGGIGNRFRLKEPWRNIQKPKENKFKPDIKITVIDYPEKADFLMDEDLSDFSSWRNIKLPATIIMEMKKPVVLKGIRIHSGYLLNYSNPSGACSLKSFKVDSFDNGKWVPLGEPVLNVPPYEGGGRETAAYTHLWSPRKVKKLRITIMDSYDTMRRVHSPDKPCITPSRKNCRIREVELIKADVASENKTTIKKISPRIEAVTFHSKVLDKIKTFSVVLPDNYDSEKEDWPVLFFFHGRGRNENSLVDDKVARNALLEASFVIILSDGDDGWYVDSPVQKKDKYQAYTEEVIEEAESRYNLSSNPAERGLAGWSMGGYGSVHFAEIHSQEFSAVASIIGLLDFPRDGLPAGQSYEVPVKRFGNNPTVWAEYNPINNVDKLKNMSILIITADKSFDRTMNENFTKILTEHGIDYNWELLHGNHSFEVVRKAVPIVINFMTEHLSK